MKIGSAVVEDTLNTISPTDVERTMVEMDDQRDRISMMTEALADTTGMEMDLDGEFSDSIDDQLAAMEMEMQTESHGSLPEAGARETVTSAKEEETSDIEDDLKALQKEMEK